MYQTRVLNYTVLQHSLIFMAITLQVWHIFTTQQDTLWLIFTRDISTHTYKHKNHEDSGDIQKYKKNKCDHSYVVPTRNHRSISIRKTKQFIPHVLMLMPQWFLVRSIWEEWACLFSCLRFCLCCGCSRYSCAHAYVAKMGFGANRKLARLEQAEQLASEASIH